MFKKVLCGVLFFGCLPVAAQTVDSGANQVNAPAASMQEATAADNSGDDSRVTEALQKALEKDPNLGPYETKLIYRQMLKNKNKQNNKTQTLKQMADTFKYDESQLQQAEALYENDQKPVDYQLPENKDGSFVSSINANPAQALNSLAVSAPINQAFLPQNLKKKAPTDGSQDTATPVKAQSQQPQAQKVVPMAATDNNRRPVQSVRSISLLSASGTSAPKSAVTPAGMLSATPKKRLGVKSYAFNPENFY